MIVFFVLVFVLGVLAGFGLWAALAAGDRYDREHATATALRALERIGART